RSTKPVANDSGQYLFAAVNIRKYSPANAGMAHSNQRNFLEHSEEPYNNGSYYLTKGCYLYYQWLVLHGITPRTKPPLNLPPPAHTPPTTPPPPPASDTATWG